MQVVVTPTCPQNAPELLLGKYKLSDRILPLPWILQPIISSLFLRSRRFVCAASISPSIESGGFHHGLIIVYEFMAIIRYRFILAVLAPVVRTY